MLQGSQEEGWTVVQNAFTEADQEEQTASAGVEGWEGPPGKTEAENRKWQSDRESLHKAEVGSGVSQMVEWQGHACVRTRNRFTGRGRPSEGAPEKG